MRRAEYTDIDALMDIYQDATVHAREAGTIDWPNPIPQSFVTDLIDGENLYCFGDEQIVAAAKLSRHQDSRIWGDEVSPALYLAKLATSNRVRGQNYLQEHMLPEISNFYDSITTMRLDCLAENSRLQQMYSKLGFVCLGDVSFYSDKQNRELTVARFEKTNLV